MPVLIPESRRKTQGTLLSKDRPIGRCQCQKLLSRHKQEERQASKMTAPTTTSGGRRRPRDHQQLTSTSMASSAPDTITRRNNSTARHSPRLLLALTTLTLGCAILFLPSLSLSSRANRRLSVQVSTEEGVDETIHSSGIRAGRDKLRGVAAAAVEKAGQVGHARVGEKAFQKHRSLQRSSDSNLSNTVQNTPPAAAQPAPNAVASAANSNRARSATSGRKLVSTSASESHLADANSDGRRLGLGSTLTDTLSDAASSAGIPDSVVDTIGSALNQLASMTSSAASTVRNIGRERQLAEVWDAPTLYDTPTFWHVSIEIKYYQTKAQNHLADWYRQHGNV